MISASDGWAVGDAGIIVHWDGASWQVVSSPTTNDLNAVHMLAANDGWAVGGSGGANGTILHWDGGTWQSVASPTNLELFSVFMVSATDGWIVGGKSGESVILRWNGASWTPVPSPAPPPALLLDVVMLSPIDGWAVGNQGTILHWNGNVWQLVSSPTNLYIISIDMVSATDGWVVGGLSSTGQILRWDGNSWQLFPATIKKELASVSMVSPTDGWAVGWYGGEILHWDGASWTPISSPGGASAVDMLSATDGWAVGGSTLHYTTFNGLTVHVDNADGQPAAGAVVRVLTKDGYTVQDGYGVTNSSGNAYLNVLPETYHVLAYSTSEHFGVHRLNITSPSTVNLTAAGTPAINLTAKKRDGTPLDQAYARVALSTGPLDFNQQLGQVNTNGRMTFNVTPGTYDVNVYDSANYYDLLKLQQAFKGAGGTLDFDMSANPTAEIIVRHPGEITEDTGIFHTGAKVWGTYFNEVAGDTHVILSADEDYRAYQAIRKDTTSGDYWAYVLTGNRPDATFQPGEVFTFTVGGTLTAGGRTEPAYVGEYTSVGDTQDGYGNLLTNVYTATADGSYWNTIYPSVSLIDPNQVTRPLPWNWVTIPYTATTGRYGVHYEQETGPYQGLLTADSAFEVKPIATSALIPTEGGTLSSTFSSTSYAFAAGTFTDTAIVTHTVAFADVPSYGELVSIGQAFDITAVYSSTGQAAEPAFPYTITVHYTDDEKGPAIGDTLAVYSWDGDEWVKETSSVVDAQDNTLTATPSHFSLWAALGETRRGFLPLVRR